MAILKELEAYWTLERSRERWCSIWERYATVARVYFVKTGKLSHLDHAESILRSVIKVYESLGNTQNVEWRKQDLQGIADQRAEVNAASETNASEDIPADGAPKPDPTPAT